MRIKGICLVLVFLCASFLIPFSANAAQMLYSDDFSVTVSGIADEDKKDENVTLLLVNSNQTRENIQDENIVYIGQTTVSDDGSYKFDFKIKNTQSIEKCIAYAYLGSDDISDSIEFAYYTNTTVDENKLFVIKEDEKLKLKLSSKNYPDAYFFVAMYNAGSKLINAVPIPCQNDTQVSVDFDNDIYYAVVYTWNSSTGLMPINKCRKINIGSITSAKVLFPEFTNKAITFSYDDGPNSDETLVGIFNENGFKATFNIYNRNNHGDYNTWYEGHEVAAHSNVYLDANTENSLGLSVLNIDDCVDEIGKDKAFVESLFGENTCIGFVWPFGKPKYRSDEDMETMMTQIKSDYKYCRTTVETKTFDLPEDWYNWNPTCHHNEMNDYLDSFLSGEDTDDLKLFYIWGHAFEYTENYGGDWSTIETFADSLKNANKNIWYATNGEIYNYVEASKALIITDEYIQNPSDLDLYLFVNNRNVLLKAGETYPSAK